MNLNIEKSRLLPVLARVNSVVERRQTLPILGNLYFSLADGRLTLVGTDLEMEISETIDNIQGMDCEFTVSSPKIFDIVRILPEDAVISIELDVDKQRVIVSAGRIRYTLNTLDAESFPRIIEEKWEERFKISQRELKTIVDKTAFAMGIQDVRYYLNGLSMEMHANNVKVLAADGHRLAQTSADVTLASNEERQLIVPRKAVKQIVRFLDDDDGSELTVEINSNHLKTTWGKPVQPNNNAHVAPILVTKLIDGKVPEYKSVIETAMSIVIQVNRANFLETLTRAAVLTTDHEKGIKVTLGQNIMRIVTRNSENEESVEELEIDYSGDAIEAGYNISYLIDPARAVTTENIELRFQGNDGICIIKQPGDERSTWLVMPRRL